MFKNNFCIRVILLVCFSFVFIPSSSVFAKRWYECYQEAQEVAKEQRWKEALTLLKQAIEKEPNPGKRKRTYGTRSIKYFPYLALGKAYYAIGDYEAAHQACEESERRGVAPKILVERCLRETAQSNTPPPTETPRPPQLEPQQSPDVPTPIPQPVEPGTKIAVLNFQGLMVPEELGIAVAEIFRTEIVGLGNYTVIERGMVEQVLQEQELQLTGAVNSETAVEIGKLVGAQFVIIGSIVKTGKTYTINSRLIDVETGIAIVGENIQGQGEDEIPNMVHELTLRMIRKTRK
jgi:TolB-like protein